MSTYLSLKWSRVLHMGNIKYVQLVCLSEPEHSETVKVISQLFPQVGADLKAVRCSRFNAQPTAYPQRICPVSWSAYDSFWLMQLIDRTGKFGRSEILTVKYMLCLDSLPAHCSTVHNRPVLVDECSIRIYEVTHHFWSTFLLIFCFYQMKIGS